MAFTGNYKCTSFKRELLEAKHDFRSHTFKLALYNNTAELNASTTDYTTTGEINDAGYTAGGYDLTVVAPVSGNERAWADFEDLIIPIALSARGALIYNSTTEGGSGTTEAVCVLDFGSVKTSTSQFTVTFPTADHLNAIVLIK